MDEIEELLQLFEKNGGSYWEKEKTSTTCGIIDYKILGKEKEFENGNNYVLFSTPRVNKM